MKAETYYESQTDALFTKKKSSSNVHDANYFDAGVGGNYLDSIRKATMTTL